MSVWAVWFALGVAACGGDGGVADGGIDAGARQDSGVGDSGRQDSGVDDSGGGDTGSPDGATVDAGSSDAGLPDICASCVVGQTCCASAAGTVCVDLATDVDHCGVCGATCDGLCVAGICLASSSDAGVDVGVDAGVDAGTCGAGCSASRRCCGGDCVNRMAPPGVVDGRTDSSFANCNGCGLACDPERASVCGIQLGGIGPPQCLCGNFGPCPFGQVCALVDWRFTCRDLSSDVNNCGTVGNVCASGETCVGGRCGCGATGAACTAAQTCCGGACVDVTSDAMNCGACGLTCNVGETCAAGSCGCGAAGVACRPPAAGALGTPGDPGESCCGGGCVVNTDVNCACMVCTAGDTCQVGPADSTGAGTPPEICCGGAEVTIFGCGGLAGGDGGLPFP